uniref:Putative ovule protein n=1 Tax=Solanum chacoense TaxID=4108 RepID=A0A0V0GWS2_SOLCH
MRAIKESTAGPYHLTVVDNVESTHHVILDETPGFLKEGHGEPFRAWGGGSVWGTSRGVHDNNTPCVIYKVESGEGKVYADLTTTLEVERQFLID